MGSFKSTIITAKGHNLIAKLTAGTAEMNFTRIKSSNHDYSNLTSAQLEALTSIEDIKQESLVSEVEIINDASVKVHGVLLNTDLTQGYYIKAVGLYANDPTEGEILYSITVAIESDWMPPYNSISSASATYELISTVSNSENVSIEVDPSAVVNISQFNNFKESVNSQMSEIAQVNYKIASNILTSLRDGTAKKLIAFGDSITYGSNADGSQLTTPWATTLQNLLKNGFDNQNITVINKGIGGNSTADGLARFATDVINQAPDIVLIMFGHNDTRPEKNISINQYYDNLLNMGKQCQEAGIGVVFLTPTPRLTNIDLALTDIKNGHIIQEYARTMQVMANKNGFLIIDTNKEVKDMITYCANSENALMADGAHFRQEMANRFAGILYNFVFFNGDLSIKTNDLISPNGNNYYSKGVGSLSKGGSLLSQLSPSSRGLIFLSNNGELYLQFYWKGDIENPMLKCYLTLDNSLTPAVDTLKIEYTDITDANPVVFDTQLNTSVVSGFINNYPVYTGKQVIYGLNIFKLTSGVNGVLFGDFQVVEPYKNLKGLVLNNIKDISFQGSSAYSNTVEYKGYNELVTGFKPNVIYKNGGLIGRINIPVNTTHQYRLRFDYSEGAFIYFGVSKGITYLLSDKSDTTPYNRVPFMIRCANNKLLFAIVTQSTNVTTIASVDSSAGSACVVDIIIKTDNTFEIWLNATKVFTSTFPFPSGDVLSQDSATPYLCVNSFIEIDPEVQNVGMSNCSSEMWVRNGHINLWDGTTLRNI